MNVLFLVYTTSANGKRYWIKITAPITSFLTNMAQFNGSSWFNIATTPAFGFGTNPFTVEFWMNPASINTNNAALVDFRTTAGNGFYMDMDGSGRLMYHLGADNTTFTDPTPLTMGQWYHVALTRDASNVFRLFKNGVQVATSTSSTSFGTSQPLVVAKDIQTGTTYCYSGEMSNLRVVKGTALYTTNFTPPVGPLLAITNTTLLTLNDITIHDESTGTLTITTSGSPSVLSVQIPVYPTPTADTIDFQYFNNGFFGDIQTSDTNYPKLPMAQSAQVSYTPDGQYLIMPTSTGIIGYQQVGASLNALTFPTQSAGLLDAKISSDSNFAVGVNNYPPYAVCYRRSGSTSFVTASSNLTSLHTYSSTCCDFSIGGNYLAIGGNALYLYKKNVATFTTLTSPVQEVVQAVRFSADSTVLYVGTSAGLIILNRVGDTFTPSSWTIAGNIQGIDVYSKYLAVTTDQGVTVYDTTTQASVYTYAAKALKSVRFSSDGLHIALEHTSAPYYEVKQWQQS